jgi:hypothetical protein
MRSSPTIRLMMWTRSGPGVVVSVAVIAGFGFSSAYAASDTPPRPGAWAGQEANGTSPSPVSFTVGPMGSTVTNFSGEAIVKAGCTNHIQGFSAPTGPMTIADGHFRGVERSYPQQGVRVTVIGTFTTRTRARGRINIHFKRVAGCDASHAFTATRIPG